MIGARVMRRFAAVTLLLAVACAEDKEHAGTDSSATSPAASSATTAAPSPASAAPDTAPALLPGFHEIVQMASLGTERDTIIRNRMLDGDGWVYVETSTVSDDPASPEMVVHADSTPGSPMVAYLDYWRQHGVVQGLVYAVRDTTLRGEMIPLTVDYQGLVSLHHKGDWSQVVYGYHDDGKPALGWVRLVPGKVVFTNDREPLD